MYSFLLGIGKTFLNLRFFRAIFKKNNDSSNKAVPVWRDWIYMEKSLIPNICKHQIGVASINLASILLLQAVLSTWTQVTFMEFSLQFMLLLQTKYDPFLLHCTESAAFGLQNICITIWKLCEFSWYTLENRVNWIVESMKPGFRIVGGIVFKCVIIITIFLFWNKFKLCILYI